MSENRYDEQEDFLARWSRRKALSRKGEQLPEPPEDADERAQDALQAEQEAVPVVESPAPEQVADASGDEAPELPPLETLDENSDYSAFLGKGVPPDLKQKALKKLFHSPKFNIRDGLDDYDWDFTNPEPLGDIITAEMRYRVERELERLARLDEDEENPEDSPAVAAVETREHDAANDELDPETDDERSEPS
ncbi:MAG TPA: DUF3306 domain-containing protein [Woeseiaceae bacterium]|nr:DUF3306 domain-containing protein [Woeseiaceae bacterium]